MVDTSISSRSYKIFPVRSLYKFYFRQCFTVLFKFSSIFPILFFRQFYGLFRSMKKKTHTDFKSVFTSTVDAFPNCKDVQSAIIQVQKHEYNHGDILLYTANNLFFTVRNSNCWLSLSCIANTLQPVASKLLYNHWIL